jgi:hypothetical protein
VPGEPHLIWDERKSRIVWECADPQHACINPDLKRAHDRKEEKKKRK